MNEVTKQVAAFVIASKEQAKAEKKSKEQIEAELKAEAARKKANKAVRRTRKAARRAILKRMGLRPNNKLSRDKKSGKLLSNFFIPGTAHVTGDGVLV